MRIKEGMEAGDESVTGAHVEDAGRCEIEIGDGGKIRPEGVPPPSRCRMEEGIPVTASHNGIWKSAEVLVDCQT
jgi:hypothetical protein